MRNAGPVRTASTAAIIIVIVPVMGILVLAILIMAVVRVLLSMVIIVTTARMREIASTIGDRIAAPVIVSIAIMVGIIAVSVAVIRSIVIAVLRVRRVAIRSVIVVVPRTSVVAASRLKRLAPRRRRHFHDYRALVNALRNPGALACMHAKDALVRRSTCGTSGDPTIMVIAPIVVVTDEHSVIHRPRIDDYFVIHHGRAK